MCQILSKHITKTQKPNTKTKIRKDEQTDGETGGSKGGRDEGKDGITKEKKSEEMRMTKRNHAWFTFNLSKGHGVPSGASARVRPLWAEQWVLIVLLVGVVGVILGHGN